MSSQSYDIVTERRKKIVDVGGLFGAVVYTTYQYIVPTYTKKIQFNFIIVSWTNLLSFQPIIQLIISDTLNKTTHLVLWKELAKNHSNYFSIMGNRQYSPECKAHWGFSSQQLPLPQEHLKGLLQHQNAGISLVAYPLIEVFLVRRTRVFLNPVVKMSNLPNDEVS